MMGKNIFWQFVALFILSGPILFCGCASRQKTVRAATDHPSVSGLRFLNKYVFPYNRQLDGTTIGGLSEIDYNPAKNEYYLICDDRSDINPARFYTARINIADTGISDVHFTKITYLRQKDGSLYPNKHQDKYKVCDAESMRYDAGRNIFYWSSEGERIVTAQDTVLINPSVNIMDTAGRLLDTLALPDRFRMSATASGPHQNDVFEGLTFMDGGKSLLVSTEEPLYQDGPLSDTVEHTRYLRFIKWDLATKLPVAEYAYHSDPIPFAPVPSSAFKINGVSSILSLGNDRVLVIERAFAMGHPNLTVKLYIADLSTATNVQNMPSLVQRNDFKPASKKLLFNTDSLPTFIDNIEGATFGPALSNGHRTLLLTVDNNFLPIEENQFYVFEVIP